MSRYILSSTTSFNSKGLEKLQQVDKSQMTLLCSTLYGFCNIIRDEIIIDLLPTIIDNPIPKFRQGEAF